MLTVHTPHLKIEEKILEVVEREVIIISTILADHRATSHDLVHCTLLKHRLYSYHIQIMQALVSHDAPARRVSLLISQVTTADCAIGPLDTAISIPIRTSSLGPSASIDAENVSVNKYLFH
jgi:hypothetical protein